MSNLRPNDLNGVVLPYISIDEFKPKTGTPEDIIVVAFYARREQAAYDVKHFIETGMFDIVDVEKSDIPDARNRYLVFVEISRNSLFLKTFLGIVNDLENVSGEMKWVFSTYLDDTVRKVTPENVKSFVITDKAKYEVIIGRKEKRIHQKRTIEKINDIMNKFIMKSNITDVDFNLVDGKKIISFHYQDEDYTGTFNYKLMSVKSKEQLKNDVQGISSREGTLPNNVVNTITVLFGDNYRVYNQSNLIFVIPDFDLDIAIILGVI